MSPELLLTVVTALGIGELLRTIITTYLSRRGKQEDQEHADQQAEQQSEYTLNEARIADAAAFRAELWERLKEAYTRNDALSQQYGVLLQEKATIYAAKEAKQSQIDRLNQKLTAISLRNDELERIVKQLQEKHQTQIAEINRQREECEQRYLQLRHQTRKLTP
ncbi:MAG: hypothetical protein GFH27_549283n403 [Chloroflexi bacterium AL-W]|nr:hypothetical protein [Chloroflexi bacterium AL-N1]NOK64476.1 hypothetical protein [Chloroflexi bacterium AL-N10]NOK75718.1 hypothetical protein [Chloroflexi bacterium AL-N5]NOK80524.1 hypothetical protein [Chloroflexi bacterium AL-W]NOK87038.1 hypothetical protein [Chloroflexi bacterium AL-N15]